ncbi:response regulator transcription factor [Nocardioides sp.]|uniref:response regulator transcription factor n=1 Tax=Nocardioides sp. TaxID=35761 RepID=UPI003783D9F4
MSSAADAAPLAVVIEDDPEVAELLALILSQIGFRPVVTPDGSAGVETVRTHAPVVVTVDLGLPGIDGFEVTRRIRQFSSTYVVMVSARAGEDDILGGFAAGADDYVGKPFRPREVRARLLAGLRRPRQRYAVAQAPPVVPRPLPPQAPPATRLVELDGDWVVLGDLRLDPIANRLVVDGEDVELRQLEFDLLELLLYAGTAPRTAGELALGLRGETYPVGSQVRDSDLEVVVSAMAALRERLDGDRWIEDLGDARYRLRPHPDSGADPGPSPGVRT